MAGAECPVPVTLRTSGEGRGARRRQRRVGGPFLLLGLCGGKKGLVGTWQGGLLRKKIKTDAAVLHRERRRLLLLCRKIKEGHLGGEEETLAAESV